MKDLDACSLTFVPCDEPVITPKGVLYDKQARVLTAPRPRRSAVAPMCRLSPAPTRVAQAIYQYILDRKAELERELKAWEAQGAADASEAASHEQQQHEAKIEEFVARQEGLSQMDLASRKPGGGERKGAVASEKKGAVGAVMGRRLLQDTGVHAPDTSFWVPQLTPEVKHRVDKPDGVVRCPVTNDPLKLKQLFPVKFSPADDEASTSETLAKPKNERYICPLTKKALTNNNPAALLRPSGRVVSMEVVTSVIKKDMMDPFTEPPTPLREKDIIAFRVEGTGFASKTDEKVLKVAKAATSGRF